MFGQAWFRSPTVALWTGVGAAVAPSLLWTVPWLASDAMPDLAWVVFSAGLLAAPLTGLAAIVIGLRSRGHGERGSADLAVAGIVLGAVGIALALSSLAAVWGLSNMGLESLQSLQNL